MLLRLECDLCWVVGCMSVDLEIKNAYMPPHHPPFIHTGRLFFCDRRPTFIRPGRGVDHDGGQHFRHRHLHQTRRDTGSTVVAVVAVSAMSYRKWCVCVCTLGGTRLLHGNFYRESKKAWYLTRPSKSILDCTWDKQVVRVFFCGAICGLCTVPTAWLGVSASNFSSRTFIRVRGYILPVCLSLDRCLALESRYDRGEGEQRSIYILPV